MERSLGWDLRSPTPTSGQTISLDAYIWNQIWIFCIVQRSERGSQWEKRSSTLEVEMPFPTTILRRRRRQRRETVIRTLATRASRMGFLKLFRNYRRFSQTEIRCEELAGDGEREVGLVPLPTLSFLKVGSVNQPSSGTSTPPLSSDDGAVYDWDLDCSCSRSPRPSELTKQIHSEVQAQDVFGSVVHIV